VFKVKTVLDAEGLTMATIMPGQISGITQVTPCFIVNVPQALYQNVTTLFLLPFAKEEDIILNFRPVSDTMTEVAVFTVVNTGYMTFICGNETDYETSAITEFMRRYEECGYFLILIGYAADHEGMSIYDPRWLMRKTKFTELDQEGFSRLLDQRTGLP